MPMRPSRFEDKGGKDTADQIPDVLVLWFDDCSKIGNIGYIVEWQQLSRQHLGNKKSYKKQHYRYRGTPRFREIGKPYKNGGSGGARTRNLCRDRAAL